MVVGLKPGSTERGQSRACLDIAALVVRLVCAVTQPSFSKLTTVGWSHMYIYIYVYMYMYIINIKEKCWSKRGGLNV